MNLVNAAFEIFCKEMEIGEQAKPHVRTVFFAGAAASFVIQERAKQKKDLRMRIALAKEMKEYLNGKNTDS